MRVQRYRALKSARYIHTNFLGSFLFGFFGSIVHNHSFIRRPQPNHDQKNNKNKLFYYFENKLIAKLNRFSQTNYLF